MSEPSARHSRSRSPGRVVLADVARAAGVSPATASAVLHRSKGNNSRFSDATAREVRQAAQKLGYRANRTFRNLNRNRQGAVGVVQAPGSFLSGYTLSAMSDRAAELDLLLVFSHIEGGEPILLKEDAVDGLVLLGQLDAPVRRRIDRLGLPVVHVNANRRNRPGTITYDEAGGMRQAVAHLAQRGRRRAILVERHGTSASGHYSRALRWSALREACRDLGLSTPTRHELAHSWAGDLRNEVVSAEPLIEEMTTLLSSGRPPDAVVLNYRILSAALHEAARRGGLRPGEDLSVIAVNTFDPIDHTYPFLTSITIDFEQLGRTIIDSLAKMIEHGPKATPAVTFPMHLVRRESS
jgi:LacI family transcriptional regulator